MNEWREAIQEWMCHELGVWLIQFSDLRSSRIEKKKDDQIMVTRAYSWVEGDRHISFEKWNKVIKIFWNNSAHGRVGIQIMVL